ncbi:MAG: hypothetical protein HFJ12_03415 [Bacilli bacterium]|nr:hypothetical protein [Bacilli bacterium]
MFTNELDSAINIYDIMAICYTHIIKDQNFNFNNIYDEESQYIFDTILNKYLEDKISNPCNAFNKLKEEILSLSISEPINTIKYYYLLISIDSHEIYEYRNSTLFNDAFKTYQSLNTLYCNNIKIYPTLLENYRTTLDSVYKQEYTQNYLRNRKEYDMSSINCKLQNYIIYDSFNSNYNITIHELIEYEDFIEYLYQKKKIKIALFPVTNKNIHDILNIKYTKNKKFNIIGISRDIEDIIISKCIHFINNLDDDVDFLLFPEMLMTSRIIEKIKEEIINKEIEFVFFGSISQEKNNICHVFYEGEELFEYHKKIPFDLKYTKQELYNLISHCNDQEQSILLKHFLESHNFDEKLVFQELLDKNWDIHVIDINKLGRILTFVCRDIDDDCYMNVTRILQSDFIFLPACNPSNDLANGAGTLSDRYHCTTIMCNTCSSLCDSNSLVIDKIKNNCNIGFIVTPSKNETTRSHRKIYYTFDESCKNCDSYCRGRIFNINIEELYYKNKTISLDITENR